MDARFRAYGTKFLEKHARATLGALFKLSRMQCNKVIDDVHQEHPVDCDADAIRESIEEASGFQFVADLQSAPESAVLVKRKRIAEEDEDEDEDSVSKKKGRSLSQIIPYSEQLAIELPDHLYDVIETADPINNPISEPELSALTDEVVKFLGKRFGPHNCGMGLARILAKKMRKKVKIGDRGQKAHRIRGEDRNLAKSIWEKTRNRTYKKVSMAHPNTAPRPPCYNLTPCHSVRRKTTKKSSPSTRTSSMTMSRLSSSPSKGQVSS